MIIRPDSTPAKEVYHLLSACVIPRPIAWVTSRSSEGVINAAPFSFFNAITSNPPTIMISVSRRDGERKDTARNILASGEFVVNVVNEALAEKMNLTSAPYPGTVSEIEEAGLSLSPSESISCPRVTESPLQLECTLSHAMEIGNGPSDVLFGQIRVFHVSDEVLQDGRIDIGRLKLIGRLSGSAYCRTTEVFEMKRPL